MSDQGSETALLSFMYCNGAGELKRRDLNRWQETGRYIKGFSLGDGQVLTFRKDRVREYYDGCEHHLRHPITEPPPRLSRDRPADAQPQILFTGFAKAMRAELETLAAEAGLQVVASETKFLVFLCCGTNAGPAKVERARQKNAFILDEPALRNLLETGEIPDEAVEQSGG